MTSPPSACRPAALRAFADALVALDDTEGLLRAAAAVAGHELEDSVPAAAVARIAELAAAVRERVHGESPAALLAHAHALLFDELGFYGNTERYYDPRNSYLPWVLKHRRGIPITLTLVYKGVLERLGLPVVGIGAPGHFLAQVVVDDRPAYVDPFFGGTILSREEAFGRMELVLGHAVERDDDLLQPCSHRQWILRVLKNLQGVFARERRQGDLHAMLELELVLESASGGAASS